MPWRGISLVLVATMALTCERAAVAPLEAESAGAASTSVSALPEKADPRPACVLPKRLIALRAVKARPKSRTAVMQKLAVGALSHHVDECRRSLLHSDPDEDIPGVLEVWGTLNRLGRLSSVRVFNGNAALEPCLKRSVSDRFRIAPALGQDVRFEVVYQLERIEPDARDESRLREILTLGRAELVERSRRLAMSPSPHPSITHPCFSGLRSLLECDSPSIDWQVRPPRRLDRQPSAAR